MPTTKDITHKLDGCRCPKGSSVNFCLGTPLQPNEGSGIEEVMSEFDEKVNELRRLMPEEEPVDFGYKELMVDNIFAVTDWGNIKVFLSQALTTIEKEAYRRGVEEGKKDNDCSHCRDAWKH